MIPPGGAWRSRGSRPGVRGYTWHFKVTAGCAGLVCPGCFLKDLAQRDVSACA